MQIYKNFTEEQLQLLQDRAAQVAHTVANQEMEQPTSVLGITVRGESYLLIADTASAVYEEVRIVPVPHAPAFVQGIANIRGHMLLIADLGHILDIPGSTVISDCASVVVLNSDLDVAFLVDDVLGLETLSASTLTNGLTKVNNKAYIDRVSPEGRGVLNITAILADLAAMAAS